VVFQVQKQSDLLMKMLEAWESIDEQKEWNCR